MDNVTTKRVPSQEHWTTSEGRKLFLAEKRSLEQIAAGKPSTPFLKFGDRVRIEMLDASGQSLFGAIDQKVTRA